MVKRNTLQEMALTVFETKRSLEQSSVFKAYVTAQQQLNEQMDKLRDGVKEYMQKEGLKEFISPNGKDDWFFQLIQVTPKIEVEDINHINSEYLNKVEDNDVIFHENQFYKKIKEDDIQIRDNKLYYSEANIAKVKALTENKMPLPDGFKEISQTPRLTLKIDGKVIKK